KQIRDVLRLEVRQQDELRQRYAVTRRRLRGRPKRAWRHGEPAEPGSTMNKATRIGYVCRKLGGSSESSESGRSPKTRCRAPWKPKPVAITVTQTWPVRRSSTVAPKMMFVSSVEAARITSAASLTS